MAAAALGCTSRRRGGREGEESGGSDGVRLLCGASAGGPATANATGQHPQFLGRKRTLAAGFFAAGLACRRGGGKRGAGVGEGARGGGRLLCARGGAGAGGLGALSAASYLGGSRLLGDCGLLDLQAGEWGQVSRGQGRPAAAHVGHADVRWQHRTGLTLGAAAFLATAAFFTAGFLAAGFLATAGLAAAYRKASGGGGRHQILSAMGPPPALLGPAELLQHPFAVAAV